MRQAYIDQHSAIDSIIRRLDPRIKIIALFMFIFSVIFTKQASLSVFALYGAFIAVLILLSKIPLNFILKRSLGIIPFVLMLAIFVLFCGQGEVAGEYSFGSLSVTITYDGMMVFWDVLIKAYLSILAMILLISSTKVPDLLRSLEKLRCPAVFIMILSFMYRYIFIVADELMRMKQAKEARSVGGSRWVHTRTFSNMIGVLFIRGYERGENVYLAMCSRGFNGEMKTIDGFQLKTKDFLFLVVVISVLTGIRILGS